MKLSNCHFKSRLSGNCAGKDGRFAVHCDSAFSLIEVLVVVALLSFIVVALMGVFSSTQSAWRANMTQTDVLESGRATTDMIAQDLALAASSGVSSNAFFPVVNLSITNFSGYFALEQPLVGGGTRTNVLQNFFILSHKNNRWYGTGYAVYLSPTNIYSLYRLGTPEPGYLQPSLAYSNFNNFIFNLQNGFLTAPNQAHLLDGVVHLAVRTYDVNGAFITTNRANIITNAFNMNSTPIPAYVNLQFYSNSLPAAVELELGILEDRTLQRAESLPNDVPASPGDPRMRYLENQAAKVHIFRQRVPIRNFDPAAYQ